MTSLETQTHACLGSGSLLSIQYKTICKYKYIKVICLPTEHQGVHKDCSEMEFGNVGFWEEGKTGIH